MAKYFFSFIVIFSSLFFLGSFSQLKAETFELNSISVEGNNRLSNAAVANYSQLKIGTAISSQDLSDAYKAIIGTELFKSVVFERNKNNLLIKVDEYPTVNKVSFEGNRKFTDERLSKLLSIKPRFVFTPSGLEKDLNAIELTYKNSGRIATKIKPKVINLSNNRVDVIFEISEGSTVEIESINFVGNRSFSDGRLRRVLESKQAGLLRKLILRDTLINERISLDKRLLTDFYRSRGFVDFEIYDVNAELSEEKDAFFISYNIKEGPRFEIGAVELVSSITGFESSGFSKFLTIKEGETYSPVSVQSNVLSLEEKLRLQGYDFIRVKPVISRNIEALTLDVEFVIEKGERIFIERIDISGNTATFDRVVRRQFFVVEGDPFNPNEIKAASDRITALGLFSDASVNVLPGTAQSEVIIDVEVVEQPTGTLSFGAGYSSASGFGGLIEYKERNFLGRGQSLSFTINTTKDDQRYQLSFFEPMFLRNDLGLGVNFSLDDTKKQNAAYDTQNIQFQPYVVYPLGIRSKIKIDYSIAQTELSNPFGVGSIITNEVNEGKITSSRIGYVFTHDTRLYKLGPKNGILFNLGQEFIGLGGDKTGLRTTLKAAAQKETLKEEVKLTAVFEAGLLTYTNGNSRVMDRFFLGSQKMRGFEPGGLGPRECLNRQCGLTNNDPLGGENFAVVRFEAEFPLGLPEEYGFSGGVFYDIGNLWSLQNLNNDVLYEQGSWRHSIGASIFWNTPIGPLRFNFTEALKKEIHDRDESFDLTISTRF